MQQHFFIEGKYLGSAERVSPFIHSHHGDLREPYGVAYFCRVCGEVWAKFPVEGRQWVSYNVTCRKCDSPTGWNLPGSIWLSWEKELMEALPFAVLLWEVKRELEWYDRSQQNGES